MTDYATRRNLARIWLRIATEALNEADADQTALQRDLLAVLDKHAPKTEPTSEGE